jgi:hypothetical protein
MHKLERTNRNRDLKGHREKFEDGIYVCQGTFGHDRTVAHQAAEEMAKRYHYKIRLTEKTVRVQGENGLVRKPLYLIWVKVK